MRIALLFIPTTIYTFVGISPLSWIVAMSSSESSGLQTQRPLLSPDAPSTQNALSEMWIWSYSTPPPETLQWLLLLSRLNSNSQTLLQEAHLNGSGWHLLAPFLRCLLCPGPLTLWLHAPVITTTRNLKTLLSPPIKYCAIVSGHPLAGSKEAHGKYLYCS